MTNNKKEIKPVTLWEIECVADAAKEIYRLPLDRSMW